MFGTPQVIIGMMKEVTPDEHLGHPFSPEKGKTFCRVAIKNPYGNRHDKGAHIDPEILVKLDGIALGKRVDEIPPHITDQDLRGTYRKTQ
jgi:hypothetical protein